MVESFHRTLNSALAKVVDELQRDWCERLPFVLAAYRASEHSITGFSPNFLMFGREVRAPLDLVHGEPERGETSTDNYVVELEERLRSAYQLVRDQLGRTAERAKKYYDVGVQKRSFQPGQWVYYYCPRRLIGQSPKWTRFYSGPFLVEAAIGPVNYVIQRSRRAQPVVVHVDKLKPYWGDVPRSWLKEDNESETRV